MLTSFRKQPQRWDQKVKRPEPRAGKLACRVLRGRGGGDAALLPDRRL